LQAWTQPAGTLTRLPAANLVLRPPLQKTLSPASTTLMDSVAWVWAR